MSEHRNVKVARESLKLEVLKWTGLVLLILFVGSAVIAGIIEGIRGM